MHRSHNPIHPLDATLRHLTQQNDYIKAQLGEPAGDDWFAPADYLDAESLLFSALQAESAALYRTEARTILAAVMLDIYKWPLIAVGTACYLVARRVPDLSLTNVSLHLKREGAWVWADGIAFRQGQFAALPDDPAAEHPDACILSDQGSLRTQLRRSIEVHLGAVIEIIAGRFAVKPGILWPAVADSLASTVLWLGKEQTNVACTRCAIGTEVETLLYTAGSPLKNKITGILPVTHEAETELFLRRAACCYAFKTEEHGYCTTCPKRPLAERIQLLQAYMEQRKTAAMPA